MLLTVSKFREVVENDRPALINQLQLITGRGGAEESEAWNASLPRLADALAAPHLGPMHLYFGGKGSIAIEYQLPAAASWCDVVLLGRNAASASVVIVELKHWITRSDRPGPAEGLMEHGGQLVLHPADQVRGYTEYCRRFHSAVQDHQAEVRGCVLFTRDYFADRYGDPPNDALVREYPCFTMAPQIVRDAWPTYLVERLNVADEQFARAFVAGRYRQDRGFVRQIGAQIQNPASSPFELLDHQRRAFALVRAQLEATVLSVSNPRKQVILIEGPPGSGKSVLAARIWSTLVTDDRLMEGGAVLTTTSTAQTSNWSKLFQMAGGSRAAEGMVKRATSYVPVTTQELGRLRRKHGPGFAGDPEDWRKNVQLLRDWGVPFNDGAQDEQYLVSIVDEAHALINPEHSEGRGQFGFAPTFGPIAWHVIRCSTVSIFLLDAEQGFRDRENTTVADIRRWAAELGAEIADTISLAGAQFRCAGSTEYVEWVDGLLQGQPAHELSALAQQWRSLFKVHLHETPAALESALRARTGAGRSMRLLASYARPWKTKGAARPHALPPAQQDFHESWDDAGNQRFWSKVWNFVPQNGSDYTWFIQAPIGSPMHDDPLCEIGCPYVVRGFDFDQVGVLWLGDLVWRSGNWRADPAHVHDTGLDRSVRAARAERDAGPAHAKLRAALAQAYRILLTRGLAGCGLWIEDDETRRHVRACLGEDLQ
ncbi:MAG TPA: DNA/RNA helicase domain-containing protein [Zeimonas sp.]|nr:DNA/RNA helicase domain-containing protein [Zeimonas sp.]